MIRDVHPGFGSWFFTHTGSWIQGSKMHRIPDPDPQHCVPEWNPLYTGHCKLWKKPGSFSLIVFQCRLTRILPGLRRGTHTGRSSASCWRRGPSSHRKTSSSCSSEGEHHRRTRKPFLYFRKCRLKKFFILFSWLLIWVEPRIRIRTKMSRIPNTGWPWLTLTCMLQECERPVRAGARGGSASPLAGPAGYVGSNSVSYSGVIWLVSCFRGSLIEFCSNYEA